MKKLFAATHATPSVIYLFKGIYLTFLLMFITTFSFSQNNNWEIGISLRPLTLKEDPYSFIVKKFISRNNALRFGASFMYKQKNDYSEYIHPYNIQDSFDYKHFYMRTDKELNATCFVGIQYGKRKNNFYWYGASDFSFRYTANVTDIPSFSAGGIGPKGIRPGDFFTVAAFDNEKMFGLGIHQSIGIQYFINNNVSVAIEGGLFFERYYLRRYSYQWFATTELSTPPDIYGLVLGRHYYPLKELWLYNLSVSPISNLTFIYQF